MACSGLLARGWMAAGRLNQTLGPSLVVRSWISGQPRLDGVVCQLEKGKEEEAMPRRGNAPKGKKSVDGEEAGRVWYNRMTRLRVRTQGTRAQKESRDDCANVEYSRDVRVDKRKLCRRRGGLLGKTVQVRVQEETQEWQSCAATRDEPERAAIGARSVIRQRHKQKEAGRSSLVPVVP